MSAALSGNHLVRFQQREDGARILQTQLFGLYVNWGERALIFWNIRVV